MNKTCKDCHYYVNREKLIVGCAGANDGKEKCPFYKKAQKEQK